MTDSRAGRGIVQALTTTTPEARSGRGLAQVLSTTTPTNRVGRVIVQVLTSLVAPPVTVHYVRSAGSTNPVLMKQPDGTWWPVEASG